MLKVFSLWVGHTTIEFTQKVFLSECDGNSMFYYIYTKEAWLLQKFELV